MSKLVDTKNLKVGDIIIHRNSPTIIKFVNVGPTLVYIKTMRGIALSFSTSNSIKVYN